MAPSAGLSHPPCTVRASRRNSSIGHHVTERLLTPSKITAFLDCGHYLTLQHRLELWQLTARTGFGSMAQITGSFGAAPAEGSDTEFPRTSNTRSLANYRSPLKL